MNLSLKNPLTGLYIQEFMEEILPREIARSQRHERPLTLALVGIDKFQEIQDQYGKETSDQVLAHIASRMSLALRQSDTLISHWKDISFLICLMECDLRGALTALERMKTRVASEPIHAFGQQIPASLSVGIANFRPGVKMETLIQEAQHTLALAQQTGLNQVCHLAL